MSKLSSSLHHEEYESNHPRSFVLLIQYLLHIFLNRDGLTIAPMNTSHYYPLHYSLLKPYLLSKCSSTFHHKEYKSNCPKSFALLLKYLLIDLINSLLFDKPSISCDNFSIDYCTAFYVCSFQYIQ